MWCSRYNKNAKTETKTLLYKGLPMVSEIINDPLPKNFTHHCMKAQAYKGQSAFKRFTHKELKFIFQGYGMLYPVKKKKKRIVLF